MLKRHVIIILILAYTTTLSASITVIPSPLSLAQALAIASQQAFDIEIAELAVLSAQGDKRVSHGVTNPTWSYSKIKLKHYDPSIPASEGWAWSVSDTSLFDAIVGKRWLRQDVAEAALSAAEASRDDTRRTVLFAVKQAYIQTMLAKAALQLQKETLKTYESTLDLAQRRYTAGAITEIDLVRFDTVKMEAEQGVDQAQQQLVQIKAQLAFLMGYRGDEGKADLLDFDIAEQLESQLSHTIPPTSELLKLAMATRPDLRVTKQNKEKSKAALMLAKRQRIPDITLNYQYTEVGQYVGATTPPTMQLGISAAIPIFYQQQGEIFHASHDTEAAQIAVEKSISQVENDVKQSVAAVNSARQLVTRMDHGLLEKAKTARDLIKVTYEKGASSLLDFLDAQRTFIATRLEYLTDLQSYRIAIAQLELATNSTIEGLNHEKSYN
jgi:cobalt-zinc-cadmium efflux system outer membrane protein